MNGAGFAGDGAGHVQRHRRRDEEDEQQRADELGDVCGGPAVLHAVCRRSPLRLVLFAVVRRFLSLLARAGLPRRLRRRRLRERVPQPGTLALDFQPNAVHAGIYAADAGLDEITASTSRPRAVASTDSLKLLAAGRADMSVVDIHDLGLAREAGSDVVGVGALVQRPLAAVIARAGDVSRPRDLEGRRVGVTGLPSDEAVLRAVVEDDGGDYDRVRTHDDRLLGRARA